MATALKDQDEYTNPVITKWDDDMFTARVAENEIPYYGPADKNEIKWEDFVTWAIGEARLLERLMDTIPKAPKVKAGPFNASLFDFYTNSVVLGQKEGHLSDVVLVSGVNKAEYHVHRVVVASASRYMLEAFKSNPPFIKRKIKVAKSAEGTEENQFEPATFEWVSNFEKITIPAPIDTASSKKTGSVSDDQIERVLKYMYSN